MPSGQSAIFARRAGILLLAVILLVAAAVAQTSAPEASSVGPVALVGTWESRERSPEGMGSTLRFAANGEVAITPGIMVDLEGKIEGEELTAVSTAEDGTTRQIRIRAVGNTLTYMQDNAPPQKWVRFAKAIPGQPAVAGMWVMDQSALLPDAKKKKKKTDANNVALLLAMRQNMRMLITPDGKVRLRMPLQTQGGTYVVQGQKLLMQVEGAVSVATFRLDGETLYLSEKDKPEAAFTKMAKY